MGHPVAQKIVSRGKMTTFLIIWDFLYNFADFATYPLTLLFIKSQPLGIGRSMIPFWKLETWENHVVVYKRKYKI